MDENASRSTSVQSTVRSITWTQRRQPGQVRFADSTGADWLRLTGIGESDGEVTFGEAVEGGVAMAPSETADSWLEAGR